MNYAEIKETDIADGPGVRVSLFVSGCNNHCPGCHNEIAWDFNYGKPFDLVAAVKLMELLKPDYIQGLTILGGEPLDPANAPRVINICHHVREQYPWKDIWLYTGYLFEDVIEKYPDLYDMVDVIVDGPYIESKRDISLRWRGSCNQRIIDVKKSFQLGHTVSWFNPIEADPTCNMKELTLAP